MTANTIKPNPVATRADKKRTANDHALAPKLAVGSLDRTNTNPSMMPATNDQKYIKNILTAPGIANRLLYGMLTTNVTKSVTMSAALIHFRVHRFVSVSSTRPCSSKSPFVASGSALSYAYLSRLKHTRMASVLKQMESESAPRYITTHGTQIATSGINTYRRKSKKQPNILEGTT